MKQAPFKLISLLVAAGLSWPSLTSAQGANSVEGANPVGGPIKTTDWKELFTKKNLRPDTGFGAFIDKYIGILLAVASVAAVIFIVYYSYLMITAQGKEEQFEKAKKGLLASVIGIIVVILSVFIAIAARNLALGTI